MGKHLFINGSIPGKKSFYLCHWTIKTAGTYYQWIKATVKKITNLWMVGLHAVNDVSKIRRVLHFIRIDSDASGILGEINVWETKREGCRLSRLSLGFLQRQGLPVQITIHFNKSLPFINLKEKKIE